MYKEYMRIDKCINYIMLNTGKKTDNLTFLWHVQRGDIRHNVIDGEARYNYNDACAVYRKKSASMATIIKKSVVSKFESLWGHKIGSYESCDDFSINDGDLAMYELTKLSISPIK